MVGATIDLDPPELRGSLPHNRPSPGSLTRFQPKVHCGRLGHKASPCTTLFAWSLAGRLPPNSRSLFPCSSCPLRTRHSASTRFQTFLKSALLLAATTALWVLLVLERTHVSSKYGQCVRQTSLRDLGILLRSSFQTSPYLGHPAVTRHRTHRPGAHHKASIHHRSLRTCPAQPRPINGTYMGCQKKWHEAARVGALILLPLIQSLIKSPQLCSQTTSPHHEICDEAPEV